MTDKTPVEIERKWIVKGWPEKQLPQLFTEIMRQGYISVHPTVRIREENTVASMDDKHPCKDIFVLCFKSSGRLSRKEIEIEVSREKFNQLEDLMGLPLIRKQRTTYLLADGHHLEVNYVDEGLPSAFFYAEIEFASEEEANAFQPESVGLEEYLCHDVTYQKGQSMAAHWQSTRVKEENA